MTAACNDARPQTSFSGEAALAHVRTQLDFGPRIPGSEGHRRTGDWIVERMRAKMLRIRPQARERILYIAHWDTRPFADESPNLGDRQKPVPGANDGASGVAMLVALAEALKAAPPTFGVDFLFVDGEDYGNFSLDQDVLIGSKYFAEHLPTPGYAPLFGIVWDMIGDADLNIKQEGYSVQNAVEVVARVWQTAEELGFRKYFISQNAGLITDDHVPLQKKGLRVIDVIDIDYVEQGGARDYHHTTQDTIDKVSAKSLQIVGDLAMTLVGSK